MIYYVLSLVGATFLLTHSELAETVKEQVLGWCIAKFGSYRYGPFWLSQLATFVSCPQCIGFHIGWICSLTILPITNINCILDGCLISVLGFVLGEFLNKTKE